MKLVLILDHVACNVTALDGFQSDSLPIMILGFLDGFAHPGRRYSNINKLTGHRHQTMVDPITWWGEIASQIMRTQATSQERERAQMNERMANIAFGNAAASLMSDLNQQRMDVAPLHVRASELDTAAKYVIYALVTLIAALRDMLDSLCDSARAINHTAPSSATEVPDMKEFFQFAWADRQYVMRKRQWP